MSMQKHILTTPEYGWSTITLDGWTDQCSYLDDVPFLLMEAAAKVLATDQPGAIEFNAEGWEYIVVLGNFYSYVIYMPGCNDSQLRQFDLRIQDIARMIIDDIRNDLDAWVDWDYNISSEEYRSDRRKALEDALANLETELEKRGLKPYSSKIVVVDGELLE